MRKNFKKTLISTLAVLTIAATVPSTAFSANAEEIYKYYINKNDYIELYDIGDIFIGGGTIKGTNGTLVYGIILDSTISIILSPNYKEVNVPFKLPLKQSSHVFNDDVDIDSFLKYTEDFVVSEEDLRNFLHSSFSYKKFSNADFENLAEQEYTDFIINGYNTEDIHVVKKENIISMQAENDKKIYLFNKGDDVVKVTTDPERTTDDLLLKAVVDDKFDFETLKELLRQINAKYRTNS